MKLGGDTDIEFCGNSIRESPCKPPWEPMAICEAHIQAARGDCIQVLDPAGDLVRAHIYLMKDIYICVYISRLAQLLGIFFFNWVDSYLIHQNPGH